MDYKVEIVNKLILRISKGDINALDELFEEVGGLLFAMAKKYLTDKSLAEDLVSEIFYRLAKGIKRFDGQKNGLNWLFKSIHNEAVNWNKKYNPNSFDSIDEHQDLADIIISIDEDKISLHDALKTLSETENQILYYKFWEGLTVREIAKKIKKPRSTVQDMINGALERVRQSLNSSDNL